jgi:hypothetical protein
MDKIGMGFRRLHAITRLIFGVRLIRRIREYANLRILAVFSTLGKEYVTRHHQGVGRQSMVKCNSAKAIEGAALAPDSKVHLR